MKVTIQIIGTFEHVLNSDDYHNYGIDPEGKTEREILNEMILMDKGNKDDVFFAMIECCGDLVVEIKEKS